MNITTLVLFKFEDDGFYKQINIAAKTIGEAKDKLYSFLKETNYILEHPSELEQKYDTFKLADVEVLDSVIL